MKKKVLVLLTLCLLIVSLAISAMPTYATPSTEISGQWKSDNPPAGAPPVTFSVKKAGANAFLTLHTYARYHQGDILGLIDQTIYITFHYSDPEYVKTLPTATLADLRNWQPTDWNWNVKRTFTGTVLGTPGGFTMNLEAIGFGRLGYAYLILDGNWVITSGTGGLADLHGQGTWQAIDVQLNGYSGQVHFEPKI